MIMAPGEKLMKGGKELGRALAQSRFWEALCAQLAPGKSLEDELELQGR
jgi:hypothetical protein